MATPSPYGFQGLPEYLKRSDSYSAPVQGGFSNQGGPSGRSYYDRDRMENRYARWNDRSARQDMAGGGKRQRGYGGGGQQGPQGLLEMLNSNPLQEPIKSWYDFTRRRKQPPAGGVALTDLAQINQSANPNAIPGANDAQARIQFNGGSLADYELMARQQNPNGLPETQQALARIRFGQQRGTAGAMQRALFGF